MPWSNSLPDGRLWKKFIELRRKKRKVEVQVQEKVMSGDIGGR